MNIYRILKLPFFGRFMVTWQNPLREEERKEWQGVSAKSKSGAIIKGLLGRSRLPHAKATIVLGHPMGKEAKGYFLKSGYANRLREDGFHVLVFDMNGFGESTHGNFSYFEDVIAVGRLAVELTPTLPIGYHGVSLGGQWATIAFADNEHVYSFAIVESAATSLEEFWINYPVAYTVLKTMGVFLPVYRKRILMVERIKEAKHLKSLLLIYSHSDKLTPVKMGERFHANSPVETELWTVSNAGHAQIMKSDHREEYIAKALGYFNRAVG